MTANECAPTNTSELALGNTPVQGRESFNLNIYITDYFQPSGLQIDPKIAVHFNITDLHVTEKRSQFLRPGHPVPLPTFLENQSLYLTPNRDIAYPHQFIRISLTNTSNDEQVFTGALLGKYLTAPGTDQ